MKQYEAVKLKNDDSILKEKGIGANTMGILIASIVSSKEWIVMFLNSKNVGEYAVARVSEDDLVSLGAISNIAIAEIKEIEKREDFLEHTSFKPVCFEEYDMVELVVDRIKYSKEGVKKGMRGCVMSDCAINGKWQIIFSEEGTGRDIADIMIDEKDLILIK